ncbi:MAG: hypothetical protein RJB66_1691 [Pseudomonadota bacterium]|jgi:hypothetical protein
MKSLPIEILAHRGYWLNPSEKNTSIAFRRAIDAGFGIETDFRDFNEQLFLAHNVCDNRIPADNFFDLVRDRKLKIAINIKSCGLVELLKPYLESINCFIFDCSIPDLMSYIQCGVPVFWRLSEYEKVEPAILPKIAGFWVDQFHKTWFSESDLDALLGYQKQICIVSPELHGRSHLECWHMLKDFLKKKEDSSPQIIICTDLPAQCREYFNEAN